MAQLQFLREWKLQFIDCTRFSNVDFWFEVTPKKEIAGRYQNHAFFVRHPVFSKNVHRCYMYFIYIISFISVTYKSLVLSHFFLSVLLSFSSWKAPWLSATLLGSTDVDSAAVHLLRQYHEPSVGILRLMCHVCVLLCLHFVNGLSIYQDLHCSYITDEGPTRSTMLQRDVLNCVVL